MFASKAGASLVIGIDMSNILDQAEKIVRANGFTENRKTLPLLRRFHLLGQMLKLAYGERQELILSRRDTPGKGKVGGRAITGGQSRHHHFGGEVSWSTSVRDIAEGLYRQWMGYFLLYESMLDTVLLARDTYLVESLLLHSFHA